MGKIIIKAYKFRIYPDKQTEHFLICQFGCCRWVYNDALERMEDHYEKTGTFLNAQATNKALPLLKKQEETKWLGEVIAQSLQVAGQNAEKAYMNFFQKRAKRPRFKSRHSKQCFMIPQNARIVDGKLKIPKVGKGIKIVLSQQIKGRIKHVNISRNPSGEYFATFVCELAYEPYAKTDKSTGVDVGLKEAAILSDGQKYANAKPLSKLEKKLKYQQRRLAKKVKKSNSWKRQKIKIARLHNRIRNIRHDNLHKLTTEITKNHSIVCSETLAVKNMMKNHCLAKALSDVALGELLRQLKYKCEWNDRIFVPVGRFFASSQLCNECGWQNTELTLKDREWTCNSCHTHHDRDVNAAKNILAEGLRILSGSGTESDIKQKEGQASSLDESLKP